MEKNVMNSRKVLEITSKAGKSGPVPWELVIFAYKILRL